MNRKKSQITPVLAAIILNDRKEVLIARRKSHLSNSGKWEFPGGKLLPNESPEECLTREIEEEININIEVIRPYHLVNFTYSDQTILLITYICRFMKGRWHLTDHDKILWVNIEQLREYDFSAADIDIINRLQNDRV